MDNDELHQLNQQLAQQLGKSLQARQLKLTLAESCTGGMVAQYVTAIAGSSAWFDCGFVTYSNQSKQAMLGVSDLTLANYGAVSEQTAIEMAQGALQNSHAHIAGSITGIAGPDGGSLTKPVGTVCFGWAWLNLPILDLPTLVMPTLNISALNIPAKNMPAQKMTMHASTKKFAGNRQHIRQQASIALMTTLIEQLTAH